MLLSTGKPKPVSDGGHRKFEMTYDAEKRTLTAAVCIEVELLDLHHINQFTGQAAVGLGRSKDEARVTWVWMRPLDVAVR